MTRGVQRSCCLGGSIRRLLFGHTARKSVNRIPGGTHETHAIAFGCYGGPGDSGGACRVRSQR